jgi:PAS domain S-box-containing protein
VLVDKGVPSGILFNARDITERNRAEEAQRESAAALSSIFRAAPIGIGVVSNRIILRVNDRLCEMTGYSREELIGKSARILYPDDETFEYVGTEKYAQIREHGTGSVETHWQFRDGSTHDILLSSTPLDPTNLAAGVTFTAMDISERKRAEVALRASEEKYRVVAEMANDGIAIVQGNKLVYINPSLANLVGYSVEEIIGKSFIPFLSPESVFDMLALMKKTLLGEPVPNFFLTRVMHRNGHKIEIEANGSAIIWEGKKALLGIIRDVTERNRVEEELRKYSEKLEEMVSERTEKLNKSLEEKEILLREVHHRVKNNLQIIISLLNLQSRYITDEKTLAAIRESQNRVKAMALVHEKLHQSTDISKINLDDYINFLANSLFRFYGMTGKGLKLTTDIQDIYLDINTTIPLGLITNELVSNSLKYAFPDGRKGGISIAIKRENHVLTVVFKDNGVGMPPDLDWRNAKSLGLRLVISLVEQLQGTIELHRAAGTTFTMVLQEKQ